MPVKGSAKMVELRPLFRPHTGKMEAFKILCLERFQPSVKTELDGKEKLCLHYNFTVNEDAGLVTCREAYEGAEGLANHLENVGPPLMEALQIADLVALEVHGPEKDLLELQRGVMADMAVTGWFYQLDQSTRCLYRDFGGARATWVALARQFFLLFAVSFPVTSMAWRL
eukprot:TRINITY_DN1185_c0_g1_i2.p2 TRINITY_DN1185_c0_g1~~TRINITY_DN1185_c0_g1_i2.p2  ORF type:complete len:170 (-),score=19.67 TRINITY_DN1185_c0_g1_i2:321-830(-)